MTKLRSARQHRRLMAVAMYLISRSDWRMAPGESVTPCHVSALAFARHQLHVSEAEATEYLVAALVSRGFGFDHLGTAPGESAGALAPVGDVFTSLEG